MMETIIAIGVGVVVGGGLLTLVYRILAGERGAREIEALDRLAEEAKAAKGEPKGEKTPKGNRG